MNYIAKLYQRWNGFLHNEELKEKIYTIVFESDTPKGKLFDIVLIGSIILSVLLVILESMHIFPHSAYIVLRVLEYLLTLFFTIEYLARIYCLKHPRTYILSISEFLFAWFALPASDPGFSSDPDIPYLQTFPVYQRRKSAFALFVDQRPEDLYLLFLCLDPGNFDGNGNVYDRRDESGFRV